MSDNVTLVVFGHSTLKPPHLRAGSLNPCSLPGNPGARGNTEDSSPKAASDEAAGVMH